MAQQHVVEPHPGIEHADQAARAVPGIEPEVGVASDIAARVLHRADQRIGQPLLRLLEALVPGRHRAGKTRLDGRYIRIIQQFVQIKRRDTPEDGPDDPIVFARLEVAFD